MVRVRLCVARQHQLAPVGGGQVHVHHLHGCELLQHRARCEAKRTATQTGKTAKPGAGKRKEFLNLVRKATVDEHGQWLLATWLGDRLRTLKPGFRNEDFGAKRLSTLLKAYPAQIELRQGPKCQRRSGNARRRPE